MPSVRKNDGSTSNELTKPGYALTWNVEITFFIKAPPESLQQIFEEVACKGYNHGCLVLNEGEEHKILISGKAETKKMKHNILLELSSFMNFTPAFSAGRVAEAKTLDPEYLTVSRNLQQF